MAEVIWTEPALADLEAIADYIAIENLTASKRFVQRVFDHVDQLEQNPLIGPVPPELEGSHYRQITEPPCRVFYRQKSKRVYIIHVMRGERLLIEANLERSEENES